MKKVISVLLIVASLLVPIASVAEPKPDIEDRLMRLEQLVEELTIRIEVLESGQPVSAEPDDESHPEPSEPIESIIEITKVKISESYSALNVEATVKNGSKKQSVDAYTLVASAYDAYGEPVKYYTNDTIELNSAETIKPGKTSPKGYHWSLFNMGTTKKLMIAISKYHTTDGETIEIPEDQLAWVEGLRK